MKKRSLFQRKSKAVEPDEKNIVLRWYTCGVCGERVSKENDRCPACSQKIDWKNVR